MLYGRTSYNPVSRFVEEIPQELLREVGAYNEPVYDRAPKTYFHVPSAPAPSVNRGEGGFTLMNQTAPTQKKAALLHEGDRVLHLTFGEGEILSVRPMGSDVLYEVVFDRVGTKKLMGNYARLKKLD
jgi:DNA helicase-2/ATP-dependent DNA helicase PcrA